MKRYQDKPYQHLINSAIRLGSLEEALQMVTNDSFVFLEDESVLSFNFKDDCNAVVVGAFSAKFIVNFQ